MNDIEIIFLAIALSIDACIVSFTYGLAFNQNRVKNALMLASFTGVFQGIMPVISYYLTSFVKTFIEPYTNLIVFTIFILLGLKFIKESFNTNKSMPCCIGITCLLLIGIATSIDAFSAGITLALYGNKIIMPAILITLITFLNSILGFELGGKFKKIPTKGLEIGAGMVLILLGIKALL